MVCIMKASMTFPINSASITRFYLSYASKWGPMSIPHWVFFLKNLKEKASAGLACFGLACFGLTSFNRKGHIHLLSDDASGFRGFRYPC